MKVDEPAMQEGGRDIHPHHHRFAVGEVRHLRVAGIGSVGWPAVMPNMS